MDDEERESIRNEQKLNELMDIDFGGWHLKNIELFFKFFRENYFKEFVMIYESYENWLRGN